VKFIAADFIGGPFCVGVMTEIKNLAAHSETIGAEKSMSGIRHN
jgi:hypothetical protein